MQLMLAQIVKELLLWQMPVLVSQVCAYRLHYYFDRHKRAAPNKESMNQNRRKHTPGQGQSGLLRQHTYMDQTGVICLSGLDIYLIRAQSSKPGILTYSSWSQTEKGARGPEDQKLF